MNIFGWGLFPKINATIFSFKDKAALKNIVTEQENIIAYGNGRSYGDSALSKHIINAKPHDYFLSFDESTGSLSVQSGVLLADILSAFVPRGWFLKVTPGTKLITVGGAIASDVHGKNHHIEGCFSECVSQLTLMLASGEIITCSKQEQTELFHATCGGMGLTGVILDATIELKKINSQFIQQTTLKTQHLKDTFNEFEKNSQTTYSVAWIDCLAKGEHLGRSLLMLGEFCDDGDLNYVAKKKHNIPFNFPAFALNRFSVKAFNFLYYGKVQRRESQQKIGLDAFFYPLDALQNWNRIYGHKGFAQYQFILPKKTSYEGLEHILKTIADSGKGSFLAVLKLYGPENDNYLSFPLEGYSLALDFKIEPDLFTLLKKLDAIVLKHGGRVYLAKDSRVDKATFEQGYPHIEKFRALREQYKMNKTFHSLQSKRVGI